ncbi:hypothetical protein GCM10020229_69910 [Kitasatospora albolonga]|uniref:DUF7848 domain-containing protein n=1 Tax=Kitasatospora albolonga TaxID=68173 RepID=UPI0031EC7EFF
MSSWTFAPDPEPDALPSLHLFQCASENEEGAPCGWNTLPSTHFEDARGAAFAHLTTHPEHRTFQHVTSLPWRMTPDA